jgi:hypothetical protein
MSVRAVVNWHDCQLLYMKLLSIGTLYWKLLYSVSFGMSWDSEWGIYCTGDSIGGTEQNLVLKLCLPSNYLQNCAQLAGFFWWKLLYFLDVEAVNMIISRLSFFFPWLHSPA